MNCIQGHTHCWHTGSGFDSASYTVTGGWSVTHFLCCWCGRTKTEKRKWKTPEAIREEHGKHDWHDHSIIAGYNETIELEGP